MSEYYMHVTSSVLRVTFRKKWGRESKLASCTSFELAPHFYRTLWDFYPTRGNFYSTHADCCLRIAAVDVGLECISGIEVIEKSWHFLAFCYRASMQNNMQDRQQTSKPGPLKQVGCNNWHGPALPSHKYTSLKPSSLQASPAPVPQLK